jgi:uncharacterized protein
MLKCLTAPVGSGWDWLGAREHSLKQRRACGTRARQSIQANIDSGHSTPQPVFGYGKPMRFIEDASTAINIIRGYGSGEIRINEQSIREAVILSATDLLLEPGVQVIAHLGAAQHARILSLQPELVLIGSGVRQIFPDASFAAQFLRAGIGYEVMDTGAACRTFNVLVSEERRVVAVLLP